MRDDGKSYKAFKVQFEALHCVIIDSSSIIYLQKIGCLHLVMPLLSFYTVKKVIDEIGFFPDKITILDDKSSDVTDTVLFMFAYRNGWPIVSDDKDLLARAQKASLPFYNTLMVLNYMYFKCVFSKSMYEFYVEKLKNVARYSSFVWKYGNLVYQEINAIKGMK